MKKIFFSTLALMLFSCSHHPKTQEFADTANPHEEVKKLDANISDAMSRQANVLSPTNFHEAEVYLHDAKKTLNKEGSAKVVLRDVAQGQAYLDEANRFTGLTINNIEEVAIARKKAIAAGAQKFQKKEFDQLDERLTDVTSQIEKNKLIEAKEKRSELQLAYLDLELKAIKEDKLGPARNIVAKSIDDGAKKFAPRSLAIAEKSILDADAYITANRQDSSQIEMRSQEAFRQSQHLLKITGESKSGKKTSSEDMALLMESEKNQVASKQAMLNKTRDQLEVKNDQIDAKNVQLEMKDNQLAEGDKENLALATSNINLESEQAISKLYEDARAQFNESEAEVYKQGDTLTVRLRGLEFPSSKSELQEANYPLLAKVQKVIESFGKSSVIVEGHTDSIGDKAINQKISQNRANVVSEYFAANGNRQNMDIKAVGYGYQKPLATNKTETGRAQNRRVDVLIRPSTSL